MKTLDERGCLDGLPFMPEMLNACGKNFTVSARADKTCDTATRTGGRRLFDTVHLAGERCDGSSHGGCQAACLNFWKNAWLETPGKAPLAKSDDSFDPIALEDAAKILRRFSSNESNDGKNQETIYSCQATLLPTFTTPLSWWDLRQYWRDVTSENVRIRQFLRVTFLAFYDKLVASGIAYRFWVSLYDSVQKLRGRQPWPRRQGTLTRKTTSTLNLQPGELVRIKPLEEILTTLDSNNKNRGLWFDAEMVRWCGQTFRVQSRVDHIINEATGEMMHFKNPCIILEGVWCMSEWSYCRRFCPRSIYSYWREVWLDRVPEISDNV